MSMTRFIRVFFHKPDCGHAFTVMACSFLLVFSLSNAALAGQLLKIATIAPQGSIWAKSFDEFRRQVKEGTGGAVDFRIYYGGVMGDDRAMYRKMRIGQLQGAGLTVTGLAEIVPDFRVLSIPFLFASYEEIDAVWPQLKPSFSTAFAEKNLYLVAMTEVGFVYPLSTKPIRTPEDLSRTTCWIPDGDPLSRAFLLQAGTSPIPLSIPDVLTSLQTGLISTVFNSYYGSVVLQWFTRTKNIGDTPFGYAYGGLVLDAKAIATLSAEQLAVIDKASNACFADTLKTATRKSNEEALAVLLDNGATVVPTSAQTRSHYHRLRDATIAAEKDRSFSSAIYEKLVKALSLYRRSSTTAR